MSESDIESTCPLCGGASQFSYTPRKDRRYYECANCIHPFLIGRKADNVLRADNAAATRKIFAGKVRSTHAGFIADIYCPTVSPEDPAECKVNFDFIPRE